MTEQDWLETMIVDSEVKKMFNPPRDIHQHYSYSISQLQQFDGISDLALFEAMKATLVHIPLSEIIKVLWPFLKSQMDRELVLELCLNTAMYGRAVMTWPNYLKNEKIQAIMYPRAFKSPFKFNEIPFALLGHIFVSQAHKVKLPPVAYQLQKAMRCASVWDMVNSSAWTAGTKRAWYDFATMRPVNVNVTGFFVEKLLLRKMDFGDQDLKELVYIAKCLEFKEPWPIAGVARVTPQLITR